MKPSTANPSDFADNKYAKAKNTKIDKRGQEPGDLVEIHLYGKIYKSWIINNINMFPSDPSGSLDVFRFLNYKVEKSLGKKLK